MRFSVLALRNWRSGFGWIAASWSPSNSPFWWPWSSTCTSQSTRSCPTTVASCRTPSSSFPSGEPPPPPDPLDPPEPWREKLYAPHRHLRPRRVGEKTLSAYFSSSAKVTTPVVSKTLNMIILFFPSPRPTALRDLIKKKRLLFVFKSRMFLILDWGFCFSPPEYPSPLFFSRFISYFQPNLAPTLLCMLHSLKACGWTEVLLGVTVARFSHTKSALFLASELQEHRLGICRASWWRSSHLVSFHSLEFLTSSWHSLFWPKLAFRRFSGGFYTAVHQHTPVPFLFLWFFCLFEVVFPWFGGVTSCSCGYCPRALC